MSVFASVLFSVYLKSDEAKYIGKEKHEWKYLSESWNFTFGSVPAFRTAWKRRYMHKKYPMIDLMSGVNLSGDFFQRSDLFWSGSLLFCLFYLCGSIFFYQHELLKRCRLERGTGIAYASAVLFSVFAGKLGFHLKYIVRWFGMGMGLCFRS